MQQESAREHCILQIKEYTKHKNVILTNSGNLAIFAALYFAKQAGYKELLIPDQGGWLTYKDYPQIIGLKLKELKTDYGLIDIKELSKHKNKALIFPSIAGYFAEQDLEQISKICKKNNLLLIEDASPCFSDDKLCNGLLSDIIVCSFGKWKIVDNHHGGFISVKNKSLIKKEIKSIIKPIELNFDKLLKNIKKANKRLNKLYQLAKKVKIDLTMLNLEVLHPDKRGINVVVRYNKQLQDIKQYCKDNNYEFTLCPRYIRVNEKAVSIELKRLS